MNPISTLWSRPGLRLSGVGHHMTADPGVGPQRYERARQILLDSACEMAFASFTFDVASPGSVVVIPEGIDTEGLVDPLGDLDLPDGILVDNSQVMWRAMVEKALGEIEAGRIEKVVLSRQIIAEMRQPIDPYAIAQRLERRQTRSHVFLVDGVVGASPELLLRWHDGAITSIPLAGSADGAGRRLESQKVAIEHRLAADSVETALIKAGVSYGRGTPRAVEFEDLRHLATEFVGTARDGVTFADVLSELHPTAAVAGTPKAPALEIIQDLEPTSRERYSGPVGWFDRRGNCEFAIALRCGEVIDGTTVRMRSGAGIVAGSDPQAELEETNWKFAAMLDALGLTIQV